MPRTLACTTLGVATISLAIISTVLGAFFYWNIVSFIVAMPLIAAYLGSRILFWIHAAVGLIVASLIVFNFAIGPLSPLSGGRDGGSAVNFGWETVANRVAARLTEYPQAQLAGTRYSIASQLGFALQRSDITAISVEQDQFDFWFDPQAQFGADYLILADENDTVAQTTYLETHFEAVTPLEVIPIEVFGVTVFSFRILLGEGYRP